MDQFAILAIVQARPGKEMEVAEFLKSARALVLQETGTINWFAVRLGPARFAIFDTFPHTAGRDAHLEGEIARVLFARAEELFSTPPQVEQGAILASKTATHGSLKSCGSLAGISVVRMIKPTASTKHRPSKA
jgi:quinol monooxygenase YgiN